MCFGSASLVNHFSLSDVVMMKSSTYLIGWNGSKVVIEKGQKKWRTDQTQRDTLFEDETRQSGQWSLLLFACELESSLLMDTDSLDKLNMSDSYLRNVQREREIDWVIWTSQSWSNLWAYYMSMTGKWLTCDEWILKKRMRWRWKRWKCWGTEW